MCLTGLPGHGKGAPDGLGGTIKLYADLLVAQGKDVNSYEKLHTELQKQIKNIDIIPVNKSEIQSFTEKTIDNSITFKGTMKVHQVIWCKSNSKEIAFRRLSCFCCSLDKECEHYGMGTQKLTNVPITPSVKHCILFYELLLRFTLTHMHTKVWLLHFMYNISTLLSCVWYNKLL